MSGGDWLAALGLLLVIEGILPFAAPAMWREAFRRATELTDGQLRFFWRRLDAGRPFCVDVAVMT